MMFCHMHYADHELLKILGKHLNENKHIPWHLDSFGSLIIEKLYLELHLLYDFVVTILMGFIYFLKKKGV